MIMMSIVLYGTVVSFIRQGTLANQAAALSCASSLALTATGSLGSQRTVNPCFHSLGLMNLKGDS